MKEGTWYARLSPEEREAYKQRCAERLKLNRTDARVACRKWYHKDLDVNRERGAESQRRSWQRMGSGRHAYRVQCWTTFFSALTEVEQNIAAHVMMVFAGLDLATANVVKDVSFDYNWISPYVAA